MPINIQKISILFSSLLLLSCNTFANEQIIEISGITLEDKTFNSKDFKGYAIIINFWYPSCPPCVKEIPNLVKSINKYQNKIKVIGVLHNSPFDSKDTAKALLNNFDATYVNIFDEKGEIESKLSVKVFPTSIFLNRDHQITAEWSGYLNKNKLEELISKTLLQ